MLVLLTDLHHSSCFTSPHGFTQFLFLCWREFIHPHTHAASLLVGIRCLGPLALHQQLVSEFLGLSEKKKLLC